MLARGGTGGVFQFESSLALDKLRAMKCDRFNDLVASLSGATLVLLGGYVLEGFGVTPLAFGAAVMAVVPMLSFLLVRRLAIGRSAPV